MNEEAAALDYLVDYLTSDATLMDMISGVWVGVIPTEAPLPAVKIDKLDASDLMAVDLFRVWADLTFLVRGAIENHARGEQDWSELRLIADRLDVLLHKHEETTAELQVHSFREESFTDEELADGKLFLHAGGIYRLRAHAL